VEGSATVECDRCLDNLVLPVEVSDSFVVREAADYDGDEIDEADNVLIIDESETDINLDQCVYDMICCSLPLQKVHNDGECNPEIIARLHQAVEENAAGGNSPFSALKDMLNNK
ncbi:MAG: DUF177 domain-containing protein, partial [Bacteroidales bacterium]|nr:DUF177 domain-containing protein [Bacteroidales bacterium]